MYILILSLRLVEPHVVLLYCPESEVVHEQKSV